MAIAQQAQQPNRSAPKRTKQNRSSHVANTKYGMGDNYGTGIKQKMAKSIEGAGIKLLDRRKIKTPPRSVV